MDPATPTHEVVEFRTPLRLVADKWASANDRGTVLLLHGGGQHRHSWRRTSSRLTEAGWTVYALDLRGHGDSDWAPNGDYSMEAFVSDLAEVVRALKVRPVLVGASLGGNAALLAQAEHRDLARGIVLVDTVARSEPAGVERVRRFMLARPDGFSSLDEASAFIGAYNPDRPKPPTVDGLRKNLKLAGDGRWHWHWDPQLLPGQRSTTTEEAMAQAEAAARRITVPTLIVHGLRSDIVSEAGLAHMRELVPHALTVGVDATHMIAGDDNDVFASSLLGFLESLEDER